MVQTINILSGLIIISKKKFQINFKKKTFNFVLVKKQKMANLLRKIWCIRLQAIFQQSSQKTANIHWHNNRLSHRSIFNKQFTRSQPLRLRWILQNKKFTKILQLEKISPKVMQILPHKSFKPNSTSKPN